jgi:hypothetical protein
MQLTAVGEPKLWRVAIRLLGAFTDRARTAGYERRLPMRLTKRLYDFQPGDPFMLLISAVG